MSILKTFCNAFKQAIIEYETEMKGKIPLKRQPTVDKLRTLLDDYQREECTRIVLLKKDETLPTVDTLDKFTIYLVEDNNSITAHWYAHGGMKIAVMSDKEIGDQIKVAFQTNLIEKYHAPHLFHEVIVLCNYTARKLDSLEVREKMSERIQEIEVPFAFLRIFKSRFGRKLQAVLDDPNFSEKQLSSEERKEIKARQVMNEAEIKCLTEKVTELTESLKKEQDKDNVQKVNALRLELDLEKTNTAFLTKANTQLQQSVDTLFAERNTLKTANQKLIQEKNQIQTDYDDLKVKYEALLQEKAPKALQDEPKPQTKSGFFG